MRVEEFRERVFAEFGSDMHRATPANVLEFLTRIDAEGYESGPLVLDYALPYSYESIIKDFLAEMLRAPSAESVVPLWKFACQLAFSMVEQHEIPRLEDLADLGPA